MRLSVKQYLLLNNLMYLEPEDGPFPDLRDFIGQRIGDYIGTIDVSMIRDDGRPRMTTAEEWKNIILAIARDSLIRKMKIMTVHVDLSPDGGAGKSAVFLSPDTAEAAIVFKGTELVAGSAQWKDNFYSGNLTDTPHQLRALEWYRDVWQNYHLNQYEVTVTGHSKGGNKAKYITVVDGTPDHCVSFDGEGFSDLFFSKYGFEIARHEDRIENHMVDYDYISPLLNDVGSCTYYYGNDYGIGGFTENHLANTFMRFGENGEFWIDVNEDGRPAEMLAFDEFAISYLRSLDDEERSKGLRMLNELLNSVLSVNGAMSRNEIVQTFLEMAEDTDISRHIAYMLAYLIRYEQKYPVMVNLLNSVFTRFDMAGLVQYVELVAGILNWKKQILWISLDFDRLASAFSLIHSHAPKWVYEKLAANLEKRDLKLSYEQIRRMADLIDMTDSFLKTVEIHEDGVDRDVHESVKREISDPWNNEQV